MVVSWVMVACLFSQDAHIIMEYSLCRTAVNVWNQCAMRLVGYTINEVKGKNLVEEFITKEYCAAVSAVLDKALQGKETANVSLEHILH